MFRAMAWKEWRQTRMVALIALAVYGLMILNLIDRDSRFFLNPFGYLQSSRQMVHIPFLADDFSIHFCWISIMIAVSLGLGQTLGESMHGTYPFLFHRPATRRWLIGMKLLIGMVVYLACAAIPIACYGLWAATPGTHASPFEWSMTVPSWTTAFGVTTLYLGAFLTGIRPGRWSRSRLLPLAGVAVSVFILFVSLENGGIPLPWLLVFLGAIDAAIVPAIFSVAENRDYP